jgi:hypothetical protein
MMHVINNDRMRTEHIQRKERKGKERKGKERKGKETKAVIKSCRKIPDQYHKNQNSQERKPLQKPNPMWGLNKTEDLHLQFLCGGMKVQRREM